MKKDAIHKTKKQRLTISVMLAVANTPAAVEWYKKAVGAKVLQSLGLVAGLEIAGAAFFLGEPAHNGWERPGKTWHNNNASRSIL